MIAAWMIYSLLVGALLYAAARAAEVVCRAVRAPTRFTWALALCTTLGLSGNALRSAASHTVPEPTARSIAHEASKIVATAGHAVAAPVLRQSHWLSTIESIRRVVEVAGSTLDPNALTGATRFDRALGIAAVVFGLAAMCYLVLMLGRLRRVARGCEARELDGHRVLVSDDVGPALIGMFRPRVVVPRWVLSLSEAERRGILAHELEHASASDPALLSVGWLLVALLPWNVGIWGMFARLRLAIEADCDARVLRRHGDAKRYGKLLLTVYERTIATRMPRLAFVERRSQLEERVRRLARRGPRLRSLRGTFAVLTSIVLAIGACETTTPSKDARDSAMQRTAARNRPAASIVGIEPPCLMSPGKFISPRNADGTRGRPSMTELMDRVRPHRPEVFGPREPKPLVLGLLLDENCTVIRDTVIEHAPSSLSDRTTMVTADALTAATFGDTTGFSPYRGLGEFPSPKNGGPLIVIFAVKPSREWRERLEHDDCGFGVRSNEVCQMQAALEVRMLDSVRALIAVRRFRASNEPVDHLFLVTLAHPSSALRSQSMIHGVVAFQSGAVYIEDLQARQPRWLFAPSTTNGLASQRHLPDVQVLGDLIGVAHYTGVKLTLEQVRQLVPARSCDGPKGSCYEVDGQSIRFPA